MVGLVGPLLTIPAGILADRTRRTRLLGGSIVVWAAAVVVSGASTSYLWLLLAGRLGAATTAAGPTLAWLTGTVSGRRPRRMYGLIFGGDLVGSGLGYLVSGDLSSLTTWRVAFWWLAIPSLALAWVCGGCQAGAGRPQPHRGRPGGDEGRADVEPGEREGAQAARANRPGRGSRNWRSGR